MDSSTLVSLVFCYCFIHKKRLAICNFFMINRFVLVMANLIPVSGHMEVGNGEDWINFAHLMVYVGCNK